MCILFSYISKCVKPGEYKLILLSNRDEFFFRPAKAAHFITKTNIYGNNEIICLIFYLYYVIRTSLLKVLI